MKMHKHTKKVEICLTFDSKKKARQVATGLSRELEEAIIDGKIKDSTIHIEIPTNEPKKVIIWAKGKAAKNFVKRECN